MATLRALVKLLREVARSRAPDAERAMARMISAWAVAETHEYGRQLAKNKELLDELRREASPRKG